MDELTLEELTAELSRARMMARICANEGYSNAHTVWTQTALALEKHIRRPREG